MKDLINKKVLVTTQGWFYGKDGRSYKAVHGTLKAVQEAGKTLGFIPNRAHANWFIEIGEMIIMGCQVMYIVECEEVNTNNVKDWTTEGQSEFGIKEYTRPTTIYLVN
jgi:hypothetical protein